MLYQLILFDMFLIRPVLRYRTSIKRQWLYQIPHKVRDVVKLHDIMNNPFVIIDGTRIDLPRDTYIGSVKVPKINSFLRFYDMHFNYYYNSTAVARVIDQSFFLQIQEDMFFVLSQDPILKQPQSPVYENTSANGILQPIVNETIKELQGSEFIQRQALINHLMKNVMDRSLDLKYEKIMLKQLLKIVEERMSVMEVGIKQAENKLNEKAKRRVKWFTNFIIAEIALLHYFIYFNLSWDIMEPVTVILANLDIMIAYWFFILKGETFSPEWWHKDIIERKKYGHLLKSGINISKYEEYIQIKEHLKLRLGLLTRSPQILLSTVQKPFKLINTK